MANQASELVFVRLCLALIAGILCVGFISPIIPLRTLHVLILIFIVALIYTNLYYHKIIKNSIKPYLYGLIYLLPFIYGCWSALLIQKIDDDKHFAKIHGQYLEVIINEEPRTKGNTLRFPVKVISSIQEHQQSSVSGNLMVSINIQDKPINLGYGDELIIPASYKPIEAPKNPYEFDVQKWYRQQLIYHQIYLQPQQYILRKRKQGNMLVNWALEARKAQVLSFRRLIKQDEAYSVATTLILGYRAELEEDTLMAYTKTGTIHALSVSGMHVGLIYLFINFSLGFLDRWKIGRFIKLFLSIVLIWGYALIAGLAPSILRAVIMLSVFIIGKAFNRRSNSYNLLAFAAFCILVYNPMLIYDVGFQLSFLSVLGLVAIQPSINAWMHFKYSWANKLWSFIALSLAAQLATFPLALYYFHQFPVYFILSNLFILLPVSLIMYLGILIIMYPSEFLSYYFEWLLKFTNNGLKLLADLPNASITKIWLNPAELILIYAAILCFCFSMQKMNKLLLALSIMCGILFSISNAIQYHDQLRQRKIIFFSLQKGPAIAFINQRKAWLYTPLALDEKSIKYYVQPALDQAGINFIKHIKPHGCFQQSPFQIKNHHIQFDNYHLLLVDSCFNGKTLSRPYLFNGITLHKNTRINLAELLNQTRSSQMFLNADRSRYHAETYKKVAKQFNLSIYDLKIKKAYLINLNN